MEAEKCKLNESASKAVFSLAYFGAAASCFTFHRGAGVCCKILKPPGLICEHPALYKRKKLLQTCRFAAAFYRSDYTMDIKSIFNSLQRVYSLTLSLKRSAASAHSAAVG